MIVRIKTNKNNGESKMDESKQMQVFEKEGFGKVRILEKDGNLWFVAKEISDFLGYRDAHDMIRNLDDDEKDTQNMRTPGGDQSLSIINESGLYSAILRSRKPEAKAFKKWITSEVLPSIRKTGSFSIHEDLETKIPDYKNALDSLTFHMAAAQLFGFNHSQAMFQTNRIVKQQFQIDTMKNLGIDSIVSPVQEKYYSATELGHKFGGLSAQKINNMMAQAGIIRASRSKKGEKVWEITEYGLTNNLALYKDSGKSHSDGTPIQHHYFYESAWHNANDLLN